MEKTKKEILLYLGRNRNGYYYEIYKFCAASRKKTQACEDHVWQSHVWRALQELKSEHLIESYKDKKQIEKGQKKGPYYRLTITGLVKIFTYDDLHKYLYLIAENHANKALIFSEWDYFEKQGVKEKIIEAVKDFHISWFSENSHLAKSKKPPPTLKQELDRYVLFYHLPLVRWAPFARIRDRTSSLTIFEQFRRRSFPWIRIWYGRRKLRQFMTKEITQEQIMIRDALIHIVEAKNCIKFLANPVQLSPLPHKIQMLSERTRKLYDWTI